MTKETCVCSRCGATVTAWSKNADGNLCIPCEVDMYCTDEPLPASVLAAVKELAKQLPRGKRTAEQIDQWARNLWFNRPQAQKDFADGKRPWNTFGEQVVHAAREREMCE